MDKSKIQTRAVDGQARITFDTGEKSPTFGLPCGPVVQTDVQDAVEFAIHILKACNEIKKENGSKVYYCVSMKIDD